ncbi:MAG: hypothetical protein WC819_01590 [Parcubacteria group bacterium]
MEKFITYIIVLLAMGCVVFVFLTHERYGQDHEKYKDVTNIKIQ